MPQSLLSDRSPLTPFQRRLLWIAALLIVATRIFALSETLWDWDQVQFAAGVRASTAWSIPATTRNGRRGGDAPSGMPRRPFKADRRRSFRRRQGRLWDVVRRRYFAVRVMPIANLWQFVSGCYGKEDLDGDTWRWRAARGEILIPPGPRKARLQAALAAKDRVTSEVEVELKVVDRFRVTAARMGKWIVTSRGVAPNRLVIRSSATINPKALGLSDDGRDLSLRIFSYGWQVLR